MPSPSEVDSTATAWQQVTSWLAANVPASHRSLRPPATATQIDEAERQLGVDLPAGLKSLLSINDGALPVDPSQGADRAAAAFLPGGHRLLPVQEIVETHRMLNQVLASFDDEWMLGSWWHPAWVPFGFHNTADALVIDQRPGDGQGRVGEFLRQGETVFNWASSVEQLMLVLVDAVERRQAVGHWLPVVENGRLDWVVATAAETASTDRDPQQPIEQPPDPRQAEDEIRDAFRRALTGGTEPEQALAAVEDGPELAPALAQARTMQPGATRTARAGIGAVRFLDPQRATVEFHLTWQPDEHTLLPGSSFSGLAVLRSGGWKMAKASYCEVLRLAGARC